MPFVPYVLRISRQNKAIHSWNVLTFTLSLCSHMSRENVKEYENFIKNPSNFCNYFVLIRFFKSFTILVSIVVESYGCSRTGFTKILVNGTEYSRGSDGINMVTIEPDDSNITINFQNIYRIASGSRQVKMNIHISKILYF